MIKIPGFPVTTVAGMGSLPYRLAQDAGQPAVERAFRRAGLPLSVVEDRRLQVPMASMVELFAAAGREAGDRAFGLRVGLEMRMAEFGRWTEYASAAPTLGAGLLRLAWSIRLFQNGAELRLAEAGPDMVWIYCKRGLPQADGRQHSDHVLPIMIHFVRQYLGNDWMPARVGTDYRDSTCASLLTEILPVPFVFGGAGVSIHIPRSALAVAGKPRSGTALLTSGDVAAEMAGTPSDLVAAVECCIRLDLLEERFGIDQTARRMGSSVRNLQRRLNAEGVTYGRILDRVRERKACELLAFRDLSVAEISFALGYADPANFSRAFRRWTGLAPSDYRARLP